MNDAIFDDIDIEHIAKTKFGLAVDVKQVIVRGVPVSRTTEATVFLTTKNQLFVYMSGKSRLLLGDVRKIVIRMGMKAELYVPPKGEPDYFNRVGREKFKEVFPGRTVLTNDDIAFYKTLASYNPALVQISEIKQGVIRKFDPDSTSDWRIAAEFSYRRIKTS